MKKMITAALALAMVLSMGTMSAFAASDTLTALGDKTIDVQAKYSDQVSVPDVYSVDLEWGAMQFTYTSSGTKTWNPGTKQYDVDTTAVWSGSGNTVTVKNNSNKAVKADFAFAPLSVYNTVTGSFDVTTANLSSAADSTENLSATTTLTLGGTLANSVTDFTTVGTITITIQ